MRRKTREALKEIKLFEIPSIISPQKGAQNYRISGEMRFPVHHRRRRLIQTNAH